MSKRYTHVMNDFKTNFSLQKHGVIEAYLVSRPSLAVTSKCSIAMRFKKNLFKLMSPKCT